MVFTWLFIVLLTVYAGLALLIPEVQSLFLPVIGGVFGLWWIDFWLTRHQPQLTAERIFELPAYQGQPHRWELAIGNPAPRRIRVIVQDEPPFEVEVTDPAKLKKTITVPPRETARFSYTLLAPFRGIFTFGRINLRYPGPLFLYNHTLRLNSAHQTLEVYPDLSRINNDRIPARIDSAESGIHRQRLFKMAGEFAQIREYTSGDDFRKINWKVTAHMGKPVVNQFEPEKDQTVYLMLDSGRLLFDQANTTPRNRMDYILDSALLLAYNIMARGDAVGAVGFNSRVERFLPAGKGRHHTQLLVRQLFDIQATPVESDYAEAFRFWQAKVNRRCLLFVYTDISDVESSRELINHLKWAGRRHRVVCVLLKREFLTSVMEQPLRDESAAYLKATAWELHRERENLIRLLQLSGIGILEVSTEGISRTVVEHYQYLKQSGLF